MAFGCGWLVTGLVVYLVYKLIDYLIRIPQIGRRLEKYVVITGCDTGFGHEAAKNLDLFGINVLAGCYTELGETILKKQASYRLKTFRLDVSDPESVKKALAFVEDTIPKDKGLWGLINNAGIAGNAGPADWLQLSDFEQVLSVNLYGLINMTTTFLPLLKKARGRIVNTASVFGRTSLFAASPYSVSKYGVEAFSDAIRRELRPFGVSVHLIEPGLHRTQIASKESIFGAMQRSWDRLPKEKKDEYGQQYFDDSLTMIEEQFINTIVSDRVSYVIDAYQSAMLSYLPRARYVVGMDAKFFWLPMQYLPEWLGDRLFEVLAPKKLIPAACMGK